jgi:hypothetical protein
MVLPTCQKCGQLIPKGKETIVPHDEKRILVLGRPGEFKLEIFKHANEADCQPTKSN